MSSTRQLGDISKSHQNFAKGQKSRQLGEIAIVIHVNNVILTAKRQIYLHATKAITGLYVCGLVLIRIACLDKNHVSKIYSGYLNVYILHGRRIKLNVLNFQSYFLLSIKKYDFLLWELLVYPYIANNLLSPQIFLSKMFKKESHGVKFDNFK